MSRRLPRLASLVILSAALGLGGCGSEQEARDDSPPQIAADSTSSIVEGDSSAEEDTPVLSTEPTRPIVDNPETEATGNESIGHCDVRESDNLCIDFTGSAWMQEGARTECANAPGSSFRTETCPTSKRIGTCVIHPGGDTMHEMIHSFYEPMDPILAEAICPGKFEAE